MELTPIGAEFESVIAAVLLFLFGGLICFMACFAVTHCYLCYKRRILRKKRRRDYSEDYTFAEEDLEDVLVDPKSGTVKGRGIQNPRPSDASLLSTGSSGSTQSTST